MPGKRKSHMYTVLNNGAACGKYRGVVPLTFAKDGVEPECHMCKQHFNKRAISVPQQVQAN